MFSVCLINITRPECYLFIIWVLIYNVYDHGIIRKNDIESKQISRKLILREISKICDSINLWYIRINL